MSLHVKLLFALWRCSYKYCKGPKTNKQTKFISCLLFHSGLFKEVHSTQSVFSPVSPITVHWDYVHFCLFNNFKIPLPACHLQEEDSQRIKMKKTLFSGALRKHSDSEQNTNTQTHTYHSKRTVHRGCHTGNTHTAGSRWEVIVSGKLGNLLLPAFIRNLTESVWTLVTCMVGRWIILHMYKKILSHDVGTHFLMGTSHQNPQNSLVQWRLILV